MFGRAPSTYTHTYVIHIQNINIKSEIHNYLWNDLIRTIKFAILDDRDDRFLELKNFIHTLYRYTQELEWILNWNSFGDKFFFYQLCSYVIIFICYETRNRLKLIVEIGFLCNGIGLILCVFFLQWILRASFVYVVASLMKV